MILHDPVTGEKLNLYASKGASDDGEDEVYEVQPEAVVRNLAHYYRCSEDEAYRKLVNSDIDNPVIYHDEVFWVE